MQLGYTLMCEQTDPRSLVRDAVAAEEAGFDFAVISDCDVARHRKLLNP